MVRKGLFEDAMCPWWICWTFDNPLRRLIHNPRRMLEDLISEGDTALDIGCGEGYFTIEMARLAGEAGRVIAVDLQEHMLMVLKRRAERAGVAERIKRILGSPDKLETEAPADFALAFWMLHEVPDKHRMLADIYAAMKPDGRLLIVEPVWHVSRESFDDSVMMAETAGFVRVEDRKVSLSMAELFVKPPQPGE